MTQETKIARRSLDLGNNASCSSSRHAPVTPVPSPGTLAHFVRHQGESDENTTCKAQQLVAEGRSGISRHGLTSVAVVLDRLSAENVAARPSFAPAPSSKPRRLSDTETTPSARPDLLHGNHGKRPSDEAGVVSPLKRARLTPPDKVDASDADTEDAISPIFFSNSPRPRTPRSPSFDSPRATAPMTDRLRRSGGDDDDDDDENDENRTTRQWLPKGNVSSPAPPWSSEAANPKSRPSLPAHLQQLQDIGVVELLEQDERPTFIIDLANLANFNSPHLAILFANASLRASRGLLDRLSPDPADPDFSRFKAWALSFVRNSESADVSLPSWTYAGTSWTCSTLRRRYRFVSGNSAAVSATPSAPSPLAQASSVLDERARGPTPTRDPTTPRERSYSHTEYFGDAERDEDPRRAHSEPPDVTESAVATPTARPPALGATLTSVRASFDWTRIAITPELPEHIRFARSIDWASTPLGPIEQWPADLRVMSNMIMGSPHPAAMYWGPEYIAIYNDAYTSLAGQKHPGLMGARYREGWSEIWDTIETVFNSAWHTGQATMKQDDRIYMYRHGFLEETFFNWSVVPLVGGDGSVVALYNPAFENTKRKVNERRMFTLREVGERTALARDMKSFWGLVQKGLEYNELDVPFALIYSVFEDSESDVSSMHSASLSSAPQIMLEGSLGVPADHPAAVSNIDLRTSNEGFAPYMRETMVGAGTPGVLSREAGTLPSGLVDGLERRGVGDPCRTVVVLRVHPTTSVDAVVGFIVIGTNPRRPYDADYQLFVDLLSRQLATSMASVVLFEEEIKRGQRAARLAALDRQELSQQLHLRTQEVVEVEGKFTRVAVLAPVGIFIANDRGSIIYCNDMWWEISRHPRSLHSADTWMDSVRDEDRPGLEAVWKQLVDEKMAITHEFRFKFEREADGRRLDTWALLSAHPDKTDDGEGFRRIFGCITDISQQKWAVDFQKQRRDEAVELKRQQENFIDITSHEMRNPLSAILQCADEITNTIIAYRRGAPSATDLGTVLESCLEASSTISLCANHQGRIANDILTLSKLDSQLLLVTPVDSQPIAVVQGVLKMFETELNANDIRGGFRIEKSYHDLAIDWVKLDPSRLGQVLINLMTNAIKFTQSCETRSIVVSLGATLDHHEGDSGVSYFPADRTGRDPTDEPGWGSGPKINLHVAVTDTGPGLDVQEKAMLFQRFSQASPRTHVQYGGSGLGLFISRILTELQGGQIGVVSETGGGSTFAFYIRSRVVRRSQWLPSVAMPPPRSPSRQITGPADSSSPAMAAYSTWTSQPPSPISSTSELAASSSQRANPSPARDPNAPPPLDILIVEDNLVNQRVLQRQLHRLGNNTHVANHGGEALESLRRSPFWSPDRRQPPMAEFAAADINISVVLMDLEMPVMDGLTCARKIRELERDGTIVRHVPIIAVTAYARPEQIDNAKAAGIVRTCST